MQNSEIRCSFYLRSSKTRKNGESPIYIWVELNGKRKHISTGISTPANFWCSQKKEISGHPDASGLNQKLLAVQDEIFEAVRFLHQRKKTFNLNNLLEVLKGEQEPQGVLEFFQIRLNEIQNQIGTSYSKGTYVNYRSAFRHLKKFCNRQLRKREVMLGDLNILFLDGYMLYLRTEGGCQSNSANKYMRALRAVLYQAKARDLIYSNPFENYALRYEKGKLSFYRSMNLQPCSGKTSPFREFRLYVISLSSAALRVWHIWTSKICAWSISRTRMVKSSWYKKGKRAR